MYITLPNEIVNKILMYRIQHPIAKIIKPLIETVRNVCHLFISHSANQLQLKFN